jgi:hypothetical protein
MILVNQKKEECKGEVCLRHNDTPVLLVGRVRIFPADLHHKFWQIVYASRIEREALQKGGYAIPDVHEKPLRLIP